MSRDLDSACQQRRYPKFVKLTIAGLLALAWVGLSIAAVYSLITTYF